MATLRISAQQVGLEESISRAAARIRPIKIRIDDSASKSFSRMNSDVGKLNRSLESAANRVIAVGAALAAFSAAERGVKALFNATVDVEEALTKIQLNLNETTEGFAKFGKELFNVARQTGQSFAEVAKAAEELGRQGLTAEETLKRTRDALILSRIAGIDSAEAVKELTAAINTFSGEALNSTEIINKFVAVDTRFAVSSKDLAEAIARTGSVAAQAGVGFDKLLGLVTAVQQATQRGGATIGNSFKTIFTKLQDKTVLDSLEGIGIGVRNMSGEAFAADVILENLAKSFDTLTKEQQASITKQVAGIYQINALSTALNDLSNQNSIAARAMAIANGATDEAIVKNEKLNVTIKSAINSASQSLTELLSALGNIELGGLAKEFLNAFSGIAKFLNGDIGGSVFGEKIGKSVLEGISNVLSGPGLAALGFVLGKVFYQLIVQAKRYSSQLLSINQTEASRLQIANNINAAYSQANALELRQLNAAKSLRQEYEVISSILARINAQRSRQSALIDYSLGAPSPITGTRRPKARMAAGGLLPAIVGESVAIRQGVGGARPTAKPVILPNFNGKGPVVANTDEAIVPNFAGGQAAIFNRDMMGRYGRPANAKNLANGFIPFTGKDLPFIPKKTIQQLNDLMSRGFAAKSSTEADKSFAQATDIGLGLKSGPSKTVAREISRLVAEKQVLEKETAIRAFKAAKEERYWQDKNARLEGLRRKLQQNAKEVETKRLADKERVEKTLAKNQRLDAIRAERAQKEAMAKAESDARLLARQQRKQAAIAEKAQKKAEQEARLRPANVPAGGLPMSAVQAAIARGAANNGAASPAAMAAYYAQRQAGAGTVKVANPVVSGNSPLPPSFTSQGYGSPIGPRLPNQRQRNAYYDNFFAGKNLGFGLRGSRDADLASLQKSIYYNPKDETKINQVLADRDDRRMQRRQRTLLGIGLGGPLLAGFVPEGTSGKASGIASGFSQGALTGAGIGSILGPKGAAVGAVAFGLAGAFSRLEKTTEEFTKGLSESASVLAKQSDSVYSFIALQEEIDQAAGKPDVVRRLLKKQGQESGNISTSTLARLTEVFNDKNLGVNERASRASQIASEADTEKFRAETLKNAAALAIESRTKPNLFSRAGSGVSEYAGPAGNRLVNLLLPGLGEIMSKVYKEQNLLGAVGNAADYWMYNPRDSQARLDNFGKLGSAYSQLITPEINSKIDRNFLTGAIGNATPDAASLQKLKDMVGLIDPLTKVDASSFQDLASALLRASTASESLTKYIESQTKAGQDRARKAGLPGAFSGASLAGESAFSSFGSTRRDAAKRNYYNTSGKVYEREGYLSAFGEFKNQGVDLETLLGKDNPILQRLRGQEREQEIEKVYRSAAGFLSGKNRGIQYTDKFGSPVRDRIDAALTAATKGTDLKSADMAAVFNKIISTQKQSDDLRFNKNENGVSVYSGRDDGNLEKQGEALRKQQKELRAEIQSLRESVISLSNQATQGEMAAAIRLVIDVDDRLKSLLVDDRNTGLKEVYNLINQRFTNMKAEIDRNAGKVAVPSKQLIQQTK